LDGHLSKRDGVAIASGQRSHHIAIAAVVSLEVAFRMRREKRQREGRVRSIDIAAFSVSSGVERLV
jgi:hypothetical protein